MAEGEWWEEVREGRPLCNVQEGDVNNSSR